jgi:rod shape determining protein RodA
VVGFIIFIFLLFYKNDKILRHSKLIYIICIILLIIVLITGEKINNTRGWITLGTLSFQPSESTKIGLILYISKILNDFRFEQNITNKKELLLILKIIIITLIPSILVFIEPDTGAVISYFIITFTLILISDIRIKWLILLILTSIIIVGLLSIFYIKYPNNFIRLFGSSIYYRVFRIIDWKNSSGMQLENSMISIATSGLYGNGINNLPIYFPEPYTDFIFSVYTNAFGLIGAIILILSILIFNYRILHICFKTSKTINKYIIIGFFVSFLYPQIQNIGMTFGLIPIAGIPLPFISYGGSSLIISFIMSAFIMNSYNQ